MVLLRCDVFDAFRTEREHAAVKEDRVGLVVMLEHPVMAFGGGPVAQEFVDVHLVRAPHLPHLVDGEGRSVITRERTKFAASVGDGVNVIVGQVEPRAAITDQNQLELARWRMAGPRERIATGENVVREPNRRPIDRIPVGALATRNIFRH